MCNCAACVRLKAKKAKAAASASSQFVTTSSALSLTLTLPNIHLSPASIAVPMPSQARRLRGSERSLPPGAAEHRNRVRSVLHLPPRTSSPSLVPPRRNQSGFPGDCGEIPPPLSAHHHHRLQRQLLVPQLQLLAIVPPANPRVDTSRLSIRSRSSPLRPGNLSTRPSQKLRPRRSTPTYHHISSSSSDRPCCTFNRRSSSLSRTRQTPPRAIPSSAPRPLL